MRPFMRANLPAIVGLPNFFLDHLELVKTPAHQNAQLNTTSKRRLPADHLLPRLERVRRPEHKASDSQAADTLLAQSSTPTAPIVTVFPGGEIAPNNPNALPDNAPKQANWPPRTSAA